MATVQVHKHKRRRSSEPTPKEFIDDCKELAPDFEKTKPKVQRIYDKWIEKGKKPKTIGKWLRPILRQWYSPYGVTTLLPLEARRTYVKSSSHSEDSKKTISHKLQKISNLHTSSTLESQKETEKIGAVRSEPAKTHHVQSLGRFNQGADEYEIEELEQYDVEYLRIIVKWLHKMRMDFIAEAFKWQRKFDEMQREKKALLAKLEEHGIK